jgi:hypothetical protein
MEPQQMQFGSVTFVLREAILRELSAEVTHHPVTRDLRDHARGRDALTDAITIDDRRLRQRKRNYRQAIDQNVLWSLEQSPIAAHGAVAARRMLIRSISIESTMPTPHLSSVSGDEFAIDFFA